MPRKKKHKPINPNIDEKGDFILRWKLDIPKKKRHSKDPFKTLVKDLLREMLDLVMLTYKGKDLKVDGFHFLDGVKIHKLYK